MQYDEDDYDYNYVGMSRKDRIYYTELESKYILHGMCKFRTSDSVCDILLAEAYYYTKEKERMERMKEDRLLPEIYRELLDKIYTLLTMIDKIKEDTDD